MNVERESLTSMRFAHGTCVLSPRIRFFVVVVGWYSGGMYEMCDLGIKCLMFLYFHMISNGIQCAKDFLKDIHG